MGLQPRKPIDRVQFFETKLPIWTTNSVVLGIASANLTTLTNTTEAAREAYDAQQAAISAARSATNAFYDAVAAMGVAGEVCINQIRTTAKSTGNPNIYNIGQIPPPGTPQPVTTLGKPYEFRGNLLENGALEFTWKCSSPRATGVAYNVYRALDNDPVFTMLGQAGKKKFIDSTIPAGTMKVTYQVQASRSTGPGPWANYVVIIGNASVGPVTAVQPKLAA